jgi:lipopolysaccharide/colanic/teichoic acid biosynthesis glycosyltransferase
MPSPKEKKRTEYIKRHAQYGAVTETAEPRAYSADPVPGIDEPLIKRLTDLILTFLAMILALPLVIFISAAIKFTSFLIPSEKGPLLRSEIRVSKGKPFRFYKFRFIRQEVLNRDIARRLRNRSKDIENERYSTFIGRYLSKYYLDELPQLYNILRGDMSWVGPRPFHIDDYKEDLSKGDLRKKVIKAGLSGLVQINKGNSKSASDMDLDNEYIDFCRRSGSFKRWLYDWKILFRTFKVIAEAKGI